MTNQDLLNQLRAALTGDASYEQVTEITEHLLSEGADVLTAIDTASGAMDEIGEKFEAFEIFLPDLMIAGGKVDGP